MGATKNTLGHGGLHGVKVGVKIRRMEGIPL